MSKDIFKLEKSPRPITSQQHLWIFFTLSFRSNSSKRLPKHHKLPFPKLPLDYPFELEHLLYLFLTFPFFFFQRWSNTFIVSTGKEIGFKD